RLVDIGMIRPDCIAALPAEERAARSWHSPDDRPDFFVLDGTRHFVRALFTVPLQDGAEFRYGVWLEVSVADFSHITAVWDDEPAYARLRFQARVANSLAPWGSQTLDCSVEAATRRSNDRPYVVAAKDAWLATVLRDGWDDATYDQVVQPY